MKKFTFFTIPILFLFCFFLSSITTKEISAASRVSVTAVPVLQTLSEAQDQKFRTINLFIKNADPENPQIKRGHCYVVRAIWHGRIVSQKGGSIGKELCYIEEDPASLAGKDIKQENLLLANSNQLTARWLCTNLEGPRSNCEDYFERDKFGTQDGYAIKLYEAVYNEGSDVVGGYQAFFGKNEWEAVLLDERLPDTDGLDVPTFNQCQIDGKSGLVTAFGCIPTNVVDFVNNFFRIALGIAGGVAFLLMVFGSYRLIFAGGNPESIQQGRDVITAAVAGLLIIIFSVFLLRVIGLDILGLPI